MTTYSFMNVVAAINGPGGNFSLGYGSGNAEEGITVEMVEDKNTMTVGADGSVMHSLHAGRAGTLTVRLLKTAPTNQLLSNLYNYQAMSSANWGQNTVTIQDTARGDNITCSLVAFRRHTGLTYAKDGNFNEWVFDAGIVDQKLGSGVN